MFILIKNIEKPKLPKLIWALRKQFGPETLVRNACMDCVCKAMHVGFEICHV